MSRRPVTEDDLNAFVDQRLGAPRQAEVAAYLQAHPDLARRVAALCEHRDLLRGALAPIAQEPLPPELDLARMVGPSRRRSAVSRWTAAAAALALLCLGGVGGWSLRSMSGQPVEGIAALVREATASYAVYAPDRVRPVEIRAGDRAQLIDWASQRLGRSVAIPDLATSGYRFMGGRVVVTDHGPAALFMYDNDRGIRLVMLTRPMVMDQNTPMAPHTDGSVNGFSWADKGLGHSLVGPAAPDVLHLLANEARRQIGSAA
jgi:anti-sigma factor RsiW